MSFKVVVLASGTGSLFLSLIDHQGPYEIVALITDNPDAGALVHADKYQVHSGICDMVSYSSRLEWNQALLELINEQNPDLVVSAGFMKILGDEIVKALDGKLINIHPSLLPKFPGAHAVRDAIQSEESVTGTTVHYVDSGIDTGKIITQRDVKIYDNDSVESLHERIKEIERTLIVEVVTRFAQGDL